LAMASKAEFLKSNAYFSRLGPAELELVSSLVFERRYQPGEMILFEGEAAEALYFIVSGAVKIFKTSAEGKEQILAVARPGESFSDVPIFNGGLNPASAQAMGPVVLYGLGKNDLEVILRTYPQLALNTIRVMASRMRQLLSLVEDLSFRHVIGRVARILLEYAGEEAAQGTRLTQRDMAAMAGTAREVVSRSLKTLEEKGIIAMERHRIVIADKEALNRMAEPLFETKVTDNG
jgi:CRP-like cAMP-binding protein